MKKSDYTTVTTTSADAARAFFGVGPEAEVIDKGADPRSNTNPHAHVYAVAVPGYKRGIPTGRGRA